MPCECDGPCVLEERAAWTDAEREAYLARPVEYRRCTVNLYEVRMGLHTPHVDWCWRPYDQRTIEARADYDRLVVSIYHHGVQRPLIVHGYHVLIGQRRAEIASRLGITELPALDITEDLRRATREDVERIDRHLRPLAGETVY